jgi:hypothetical protein
MRPYFERATMRRRRPAIARGTPVPRARGDHPGGVRQGEKPRAKIAQEGRMSPGFGTSQFFSARDISVIELL